MPATLEERKSLPTIWRSAAVVPDSFDMQSRTVEVQWTTGAAVRRFRWVGWDIEEFEEELDLSSDAVRMQRLTSGRMAVLDNHNSYTGLHGDRRYGQIGVVVDGGLRDGAGWARVQFSRRASLDELMRDFADGVITPFSFGYRVHAYRDITEKDDPITRLLAIDWEPYELSPVSIPADIDAHMRTSAPDHLRTSAQEMTGDSNACIVLRSSASEGDPEPGEREMPKTAESETRSETPETPTPATPPPADPTPPARSGDDPEALRRAQEEGARKERERATKIRELVGKARLSDDFAVRLIDDGVDLERAKDLIFDELAKGDRERGIEPHRSEPSIEVGEDQVDKVKRGIEQALEFRTGNRKDTEVEDVGREFRGCSVVRMAEEYLRARGVRDVPRNPWEVAKRALHHSSDFPLLLENVANKSLLRGYREVPQTFMALGNSTTSPDFKELVRVKLGEAPDMKEVPESGEYEYGTFGEKGERYAVKTYGRIIAFTRKLMVNDDLDGLSRFPRAFGASAARKRGELAWSLITTPVTMGDGVALFHASHGNLGSDAFGETGLSNALLAMRKQKGINGKRIQVTPRFLVVPAALEVAAKKQLSAIQATTTGDTNVFASAYSLIVESLLDDDSAVAWYLFANPVEHDIFEWASLDGVGEEPVFESEFGFDVDGVKFKARIDFGIHVLDWVGAYKSTT